MDSKALSMREQKIHFLDGRVMTVEEAYEWVLGERCCEFCKHNVNEIGEISYCDINVRGTLIDYDIFGEKVNLMPTLSNCEKYEPAKPPWFLEKE